MVYWYKFEEFICNENKKYYQMNRFFVDRKLEYNDLSSILKNFGGSRLEHTELNNEREIITLEETKWRLKNNYSIIQYLGDIEKKKADKLEELGVGIFIKF